MRLPDILEAIDAAFVGDWQRAHGIVQRDASDPTACRLHAVPRKIEGDAGNSRYGYARTAHDYSEYPHPAGRVKRHPGYNRLMSEPIRLSKLMSERGICSRREADVFIEQGLVFVDGQRIAELGTRVDPNCEIHLAQAAQKQQQARVTILLHKPVGYVSGQPEPGFIPAVTLIAPEHFWPGSGGPPFRPAMLKGLAPAGRLDIDSTGLLVLTQDGRIAKQLIGEDSDIEKEYLVRVEGNLSEDGLRLLNHGLELDGKKLRPATVAWQNEDQLKFILKEGKKRQIRRMCDLVGLKVTGLKRVRIGDVRLGELPLGQWRFLKENERFRAGS